MKMHNDLLVRLTRARWWVVAQFVGTLVLIAVGLAWTRLPEKYFVQVALDLLIPLLLVISALELQASTIRSLADNDGKRVKLVWGAITLLVWIAIGAAFWAFLDWCDDQIPQWSDYIHSQLPAHQRAQLFTWAYIQLWLDRLEWVLRWVVLPAKLIPYGVASVQWGWRLPIRRILRMLFNWRWWLAVVLAATIGVAIPTGLFSPKPHGTVSEQIWTVVFKVAVAYVLAVGSWVLLLAWVVTLFGRQQPPTEEALVAEPVLAGPPRGNKGATAEIPPPDDTP
ncbi:MAG: hypothetical protein WBQ94_20145 [Terracidiphilus sp.]